jgi:hypothetical protein
VGCPWRSPTTMDAALRSPTTVNGTHGPALQMRHNANMRRWCAPPCRDRDRPRVARRGSLGPMSTAHHLGDAAATLDAVRGATRACRICGRDCVPTQWRAGRCPRCTMYWRAHGVERPPEPRRRLLPRPCARCGRLTTAPVRGWCSACYQEWRRHRAADSRPLPHERPCQNCGQLVQGLRRERCPACYMFWYRHGRDRPAALWQR